MYQLKGMPDASENQEELLGKIIASSLASQMQEEDSQQKAAPPDAEGALEE